MTSIKYEMLQNPNKKNTILKFSGTDNERAFGHNKRKLGKEWEYNE
jgi:hypothetical protein